MSVMFFHRPQPLPSAERLGGGLDGGAGGVRGHRYRRVAGGSAQGAGGDDGCAKMTAADGLDINGMVSPDGSCNCARRRKKAALSPREATAIPGSAPHRFRLNGETLLELEIERQSEHARNPTAPELNAPNGGML